MNEIIEKNEDKDDKAVLDECSEVGEIKALLPDINSRVSLNLQTIQDFKASLSRMRDSCYALYDNFQLLSR